MCLALVQTIVPAAADAAVATFTDAAAAAGEEGFDALWEAWADRCDTAYAVVEPLMAKANEIVRERWLARKPWVDSLTIRMRDLEGRMSGNYGRGWPR